MKTSLSNRSERNADANGRRSTTRRRRLIRYVVILVLANLLPLAGYRALVWHQQSRIREFGGTTVTGTPPIYYTLAYTTRSPVLVRRACTTNVGRWLFNQFPVIYTVDLRGVRDPKAITVALHCAKSFDNVTELILYQSAVTDDHLAILPHGFPELERLKINETGITDAGISHLRDLPQLRLINAQRTKITNAAVPDLATMSRLKELNIADTEISDVTPVHEAHPMCFINRQLVTVSESTDFHRVSGH